MTLATEPSSPLIVVSRDDLRSLDAVPALCGVLGPEGIACGFSVAPAPGRAD